MLLLLHSHTPSHSHPPTLPLSFTHTNTHTHSLTHYLTHTHSLTHTHTLTHTHPPTLPSYLSLSHTHKHTHALTYSLSTYLFHTNTHTITLILTYIPTYTERGHDRIREKMGPFVRHFNGAEGLDQMLRGSNLYESPMFRPVYQIDVHRLLVYLFVCLPACLSVYLFLQIMHIFTIIYTYSMSLYTM